MFTQWKVIINKPLKIVNLLINIIVVGTSLFLFLYWKHIPEQVPQHWNLVGEIDDYADAGSYIMLLILMYFFGIGHHLTKLICMFDWKENLFGKELVAKVSSEVEGQAFNTLMGMLWYCDLCVQMCMAYIIFCGVFLRSLGIWFLPAVFILLTVDFVWFGIRIVQLKNSVR